MINFRNQKGSITIFVIASCLLFVTTVMGIATYVQNKVNNEEEEYRKIKATYEQDVGKESEFYSNIVANTNINSSDTSVNFAQKEVYIIPTGSTTVLISQKFDVVETEEISTIEYAWTDDPEGTVEDASWVSLQKGEDTYTVKSSKEAGNFYLKVRLNETEIITSEEIIVNFSEITVDTTNRKIVFGADLKYNFKVGIGTTIDEAKANKQAVSVNENNEIDVTINSGEYIYAEATDSYGNKVYNNVQF